MKIRFKTLKICSFLWISLIVLALSMSNILYAQEPLTITHSLSSYTDNGPTITLVFALNITNNSDIPLIDATISVTPMGPIRDHLLIPTQENLKVSIGDIPAFYENITVTYTIQSALILPEEEINNFPLICEIEFTDETYQRYYFFAESKPRSIL